MPCMLLIHEPVGQRQSRTQAEGFFLGDCDTREEAVAIARECPAAEWATVEVRTVGPCYT